jgi:hypothetical protein
MGMVPLMRVIVGKTIELIMGGDSLKTIEIMND